MPSPEKQLEKIYRFDLRNFSDANGRRLFTLVEIVRTVQFRAYHMQNEGYSHCDLPVTKVMKGDFLFVSF